MGNQPQGMPVSNAGIENITHPTCDTNASQPTQDANNSLGLLGAGMKVLLHAINDLSRHGIDTTIPLPKIVVVGNQSAGKSSLIEAIR